MPSGLHVTTALKLGLMNVAHVALYRLGLKTGLHPVTRIHADIDKHEFFIKNDDFDFRQPIATFWNDQGLYFGRHLFPLPGGKPAWFTNPFTGQTIRQSLMPWWKLPDFGLSVGDIKTIWEPSRFDWVLHFAQCACTGDTGALERLNDWLADWLRCNPPYLGPNWKCGQEAAIRVMHLGLAARFLGQDTTCRPDFTSLIDAHLQRIEPTLGYALAQDNNHGTSEAAGLFIGGLLCRRNNSSKAQRWIDKGRRTLEKRVQRLFAPDGSFSQYSVNYHRLALDTLCLTECWRRWYDQPPFSKEFYQRGKAAVNWLFSMVNPQTGDAPNIGNNDGANLLPLCDADYRDYRPSVQLAMTLFNDCRAYTNPDVYDAPLSWLDIAAPDKTADPADSVQYDHGGYVILRKGSWMTVMRYPRYRFRPSHCDALHIDVWCDAENLLRDAGTYSYHAGSKCANYFQGTAAHNTIQFDDRDQMPRLGRFLRGAWLKTNRLETLQQNGDAVSFAAGYRDWQGASHFRRLRLGDDCLLVEDSIEGFAKKSILRWRLLPGNWQLDGYRAYCDKYSLKVSADVPVVRCELLEGWESRYYMEKTTLPVLEIEVHAPGRLVTEIHQ